MEGDRTRLIGQLRDETSATGDDLLDQRSAEWQHQQLRIICLPDFNDSLLSEVNGRLSSASDVAVLAQLAKVRGGD